ncbi:MAG: hypothetical protein ACLTK0_00635 [Anaerovoracaceae bacterium]
MKKILSFSLTAVMAMGMAFIMTGCGGGEPYEKYDLTEYITLPDYNSYEVTEPEVVISDEDVEEGIQAKLDAAATTEDVTGHSQRVTRSKYRSEPSPTETPWTA